MSVRTIMNYPYVFNESFPGRCRHQVTRLGRLEPCYRPSAVRVADIGLCRQHYGHFQFWQRGGLWGTPAEVFAQLVARGEAGARREDARTGEVTVTSVRAPAGMAFYHGSGGQVGYAELERFRGKDGQWRWRLNYPTSGRRRIAHRSVRPDDRLRLDVEVVRE